MDEAAHNWRSPGSHGKPAHVHIVSVYKLEDGTRLAVCFARIASTWNVTDDDATCKVCLGTNRSQRSQQDPQSKSDPAGQPA
jgi:hypothetical protein